MMTCAHPLCSSIVRKGVVGVTGALLILFVLGHMAGNLLIFLPPEAINGYAEFLHEAGHGALIWLARAGLILLFVIHLGVTIALKYENKKARPIGYAAHDPQVSGWASRHMLLTGIVVLLFVIYHIMHFTLGLTDSSTGWRTLVEGPSRPHYVDVHSMVVHGFRDPYIASFYILCQVVLGLHLWHGGSSLFQSLGINRGPWRAFTAWVGPVVAVVVVAGNCSIPLAIQAGCIPARIDLISAKAAIEAEKGPKPPMPVPGASDISKAVPGH